MNNVTLGHAGRLSVMSALPWGVNMTLAAGPGSIVTLSTSSPSMGCRRRPNRRIRSIHSMTPVALVDWLRFG
jgi:hypothetical protein